MEVHRKQYRSLRLVFLCSWGLVLNLCIYTTTSSPTGNMEMYVVESDAVEGLCEAQCHARCHDFLGPLCDSNCGGPGSPLLVQQPATWEVTCSEQTSTRNPSFADCVGTCSTWAAEKGYVPRRPDVAVTRDPITRRIILSWGLDPQASRNTIYVVSQHQPSFGQNRDSWVHIGWVRGDYYHINDISDICITPEFRVASVSRYGSRWFSRPVRTPGPPRNVRLTHLEAVTGGENIYYTLQWEAPDGWSTSDIQQWHQVQNDATCYQRGMLDVIYVFRDRIFLTRNTTGKDVFKMHGRISTYAIGCNITFRISSISRCNNRHIGTPADFTIDLSCDRLLNYKGRYCQNPPVIEPGPVRDVTLAIISLADGILALLSWRPPISLGSAGKVERYHVFWGIVDLMHVDLFIDFKSLLGHKHVPGSDHGTDIYINITTLGPYETVGVVVRAAGPRQIIDTPYGDINLAFNSATAHSRTGTVLSDDGTMVVVQPDLVSDGASSTHTVGVDVYWRRSQLEKGLNITPADYSLVWGEIRSRYLHDNESVQDQHRLGFKPINVTSVTDAKLSVYNLTSNTTYGIKILPVASSNRTVDDANDVSWDTVELHVFTTLPVNETTTFPTVNPTNFIVPTTPPQSSKNEASETINNEGAWALDVAVVLVCVFVILMFAMLYSRRRQRRRRPTIAMIHLQDPEYRPYSYFAPGTSLDNSGPQHCPVVADEWELPLSSVKFGPVLGSGAFGQVVKGRVTRAMLTHRGVAPFLADDAACLEEGDKLHATVAIKMLQENCDGLYKQDFVKEIHLMKKIGYHQHVVSMLGCCTLRDPICLVVEHLSRGDLLAYLKDARRKLYSVPSENNVYVNQDEETLQPTDLLKFAWQITQGMDFLASKGFVHRDLAARNVLVGSNKTCKIGDFGLARYVYDNAIYVNRKGGRLPLKWMSVEAIFDMSFSTASDVWSFGIVLYEIVTLGGTPYPTIPTRDILKELQRGYRMERPPNCSLKTYQLMLQCWQEDPAQRPSFSALSDWLNAMISDKSGLEYLDMRIDTAADLYTAVGVDGGGEDEVEEITVIRPETEAREERESSSDYPTSHYHMTRSREMDRGASRLCPVALSEDSGYISPVKESVSSGDSVLTAPSDPTAESLETSSVQAVQASRDMQDPNLLEHSAEPIVDDVFQDGVDVNLKSCDKETSSSATHRKLRETVTTGHSRSGTCNTNPRSRCKSPMTRKIQRRCSLPVIWIRSSWDNLQNCDIGRSKSDSNLMKFGSTPRAGQQTVHRLRQCNKDLKFPADSVATKKSKGNKRRRNAVVTPPTLALDNKLYKEMDYLHRQNPPPVRISRKKTRMRTLEVANPSSYEDENYSVLGKFCRKTVTKSADLTPELVQNDVTQSSEVRCTRNSFTVVAEIHCEYEDNHKKIKDYIHLSQPVDASKTTDAHSLGINSGDNTGSKENVLKVPRVKRTFVRSLSPVQPADGETPKSGNRKRKKGKVEKRLPSIHQYADFKTILNQTLSALQFRSSVSEKERLNRMKESAVIKTTEDIQNSQDRMCKQVKYKGHVRSLSEDSAVQTKAAKKCSDLQINWTNYAMFRESLGSLSQVKEELRNSYNSEKLAGCQVMDTFIKQRDTEVPDKEACPTKTALKAFRRLSDPSFLHITGVRKVVCSPFQRYKPDLTIPGITVTKYDDSASPEKSVTHTMSEPDISTRPRDRVHFMDACTDTKDSPRKIFPNEKHPSALHLVLSRKIPKCDMNDTQSFDL